jgi:capsid protein
MTPAQIAYETKRAAKAGVSLDKWLATKRRQQAEEAKERAKAAEPPAKKKDGLIARLLERAHKPL